MALYPSQSVRPTAGLLVVDGRTVEALVTAQDAIDLADAALRKTSNGVAHQDVRRTLDLPGVPGACLSLMYASPADRPLFGAKVLSVSPQNFEDGLPSHQGGVLLFEREHGRPVALINAHAITGLRTPAASAVATRTLSRADSCDLTLIGYGEQAERHVDAIALVRPITRIRVWGRDPGKAARFAEAQSRKGYSTTACSTVRDAVEGADIVCTVTSAKFPILEGKWISAGTHINAVGASIASLKELDVDCVTRSSIWVDYMPMAMTSASDLTEPLGDGRLDPSQIIGEIGAVLNGDVRGRRDPSEITLYRSLGVPAQDIELANFIYLKAKDLGLGVEVSL
ncbi:ornithine cyclodeaminase family protein [Rhizobium sp. CG5]|uniref:ornithine cyclodeaminase family protein n=1 Tax=Rhizobium sp. CG5 TaxID=2726076 RepID=UPI002033F9BC|nr:ornithine cyclodeaminase family protein [Rhizobium sp. CG5]MCM2474514.1 ornithine cyclodeaminase family protein [Rhizobium sp. CG5]